MTSETPTLAQRIFARLHAAVTRPRLEAMARHLEEAKKREPAELLVRHLTVEHLGRWITLHPQPDSARTRAEPTLLREAGRLVGFAPGPDPARSPSTIGLVLLRGAPVTITARVDDHVIVAPRDWN